MSADSIHPRRRTRVGSKDDLSLLLPPVSTSQGWVGTPASAQPISPRPGLVLSAQSVVMRSSGRSPRRGQKRARRTLEDGMVRPPDPSRDPARLKRQRIIDELLDTEKRFVTVLDVLESEIREPVRTRHLLSGEQVEALFANVGDIRRLHKSFLLRLWLLTTAAPAPFHNKDVDKRLFHACDDLPRIFLEYARQASILSLYCKAHATAQSTQLLPELLRTQAPFAEFIKKQLAMPQANRQTLQSLLAAIPQRVCKYPLLLKEYLKTLEEGDEQQAPMQEALEALNGLLDAIDQHTGPVMSDFAQLKRIAGRLKASRKHKFHLLEDGRAFIHEGDFEVLKPQQYGSYAFLFSDVLLLTKPRGDLYKITRVLPLSALILCAPAEASPPTPADAKPLLQMAEVGRGLFCVQFPSPAEHTQWAAVLRAQLNPPSTPSPTLRSPTRAHTLRLDGSQTSRGVTSKGLASVASRGPPSVPALRLPTTHQPSSLPLPSDEAVAVCEACARLQARLDKERQRRKEAEAQGKEMKAALKSLQRRVAQQNKIILDLSQLSRAPAPAPAHASPLARSRTLPNTPEPASPPSYADGPGVGPTHPLHVLEAVRDRLHAQQAPPREEDSPAPALRTRSEDLQDVTGKEGILRLDYSESTSCSTYSLSDSEEVSVREGFSSRAYKQAQANRKTVLIHRASQPTLVRIAQPTLLAPACSTPSSSEREREKERHGEASGKDRPSLAPLSALPRVIKRRRRSSSRQEGGFLLKSKTRTSRSLVSSPTDMDQSKCLNSL